MWQTLKKVFGQQQPGAGHSATVYTRQGCHLCDEAFALLQRYGLEPELIDIDADLELVERYTHCVPVVFIDGQERFRGRVNEVLLRRLLRTKPAS